MTHAVLSPSSAVRWASCPGSVVLSKDIPQRRNSAAARGTVCHLLAEETLVYNKTPANALGLYYYVGEDEVYLEPRDGAIRVIVDQGMIDTVQTYVTAAREYMEGADDWMIEERVSIGFLTGEPEAKGTADLVVVRGNELQVHDLKAGYHAVEAENNPQLKIYALGVLMAYAPVLDIDTVLCVIHQPEHGGPKEARYTVEELDAFAAEVALAASQVRKAQSAHDKMDEATWDELYLRPGEKQCHFCPARATCPALQTFVEDAVSAEFETLSAAPSDLLAAAMGRVDLVETWCKAVRAEVERRLVAGTPVTGFKLVQGRRGARQWTSSDIAEQVLVRVLGDKAYTREVVSPTAAEKLLKPHPERWAPLAELVRQAEGKPSVAPESDKREAITVAVTADEFEVVE